MLIINEKNKLKTNITQTKTSITHIMLKSRTMLNFIGHNGVLQ